MANQLWGQEDDFLLRGTTRFQGYVSTMEGTRNPADGLVNAAGANGNVVTLTANADLTAYDGGIFLVNDVGANRSFTVGAPVREGRHFRFILTYGTALPANRTAVFRSNTGNISGVMTRSAVQSTTNLDVANATFIGFQGGTTNNRARRGAEIELFDQGNAWFVVGFSRGANPFTVG